MSPVIVHSGEMGDNDHLWFAEFLRQYLPQASVWTLVLS